MIKLPLWVLPNNFPAIFDTESHTAIEMTSRLYGAINDFVNEYNHFATETTQALNEHLENYSKANETFRTGLRQEFQDFIDTINLKVMALENISNQAIVTYKNEITNMFNLYKADVSEVKEILEQYMDSALTPEECTELRGLNTTVNEIKNSMDSVNEYMQPMGEKVETMYAHFESGEVVLMEQSEIDDLYELLENGAY